LKEQVEGIVAEREEEL